MSWLKGDMSLRALAYYVDTYETETLSVTTVNQAGQLGQPRFRWTAQMGYEEGPWSGFLQARYSGKGYFDKRTAATDLPQLEIGAQTLIDMNLAYEIPVANGKTSTYLNVTNVFNELPPAFSGGGNNYDPIGRFYRVGVKVEF